MTFEQLGLSPELLSAVVSQGYTEPTPVQAQAIPAVLAGRDMMAAAQTGTGKTAAFTLPILQRLQAHANKSMSPAMHPVRALILTPTRELCDQVAESVRTYGQHIPLRYLEVFGGVSMEPQTKALQAGVEILVATPGRLLDHVQQRTVNLSRVEMLVLDEADRMLDMGFILDIRRIIGLLPATRQMLLFSATFAPEIRTLAQEFMRDPLTIEVARRNTTAENVQQVAYAVAANDKTDALVRLLEQQQMSQVIVFTRTRQSAEQLARRLLRRGENAAAIHGDKDQSTRLATLASFKDGKTRVLVATDVAARGLDVEQLPFVVNYELPPNPEDYVHRIGRTGRAGASGCAISLCAPEEQKLLVAIEKFTKRNLALQSLPVPPPPPAAVRRVRETEPETEFVDAPRRGLHRPILSAGVRAREPLPALLLPPRVPVVEQS